MPCPGSPSPNPGLPEGGTPFVREPSWQSEFQIIVGGKNFGCGSSREHAPYALCKAGAKAVIAPSYARIFLPQLHQRRLSRSGLLEEDLSKVIRTGDELETRHGRGQQVAGCSLKGLEFDLIPLGDVAEVIAAGNVFEYAKKVGMAAS